MEKRYIRKVDLHGGSAPIKNIRYIRGDIDVYPLELYLVAWDIPFVIPDDATVFINFTRPDAVVDKAAAEILDANKGHISYKIQGSEISVAGRLTAAVEIVTGEQLLTFEQKINIDVWPDPNGQTVEVPSEYSLWVNEVNQELLRLTELIGSGGGGGGTGSKGDNGWSSILGVVPDGERQVLSITAWTGGTGKKPTLLGYLGETGVVVNIADAVDIRGAKGKDGTDGNDGKDGIDGTDGAAATIAVGSTVTVEAGTAASVTNTGTNSNAVFDFVIPKGEPGLQGEKGDPGESASTAIGFSNQVDSFTLAANTQRLVPIVTDIGAVQNGAHFIVPKAGWWTFSIYSRLTAYITGTANLSAQIVHNDIIISDQNAINNIPIINATIFIYCNVGDAVFYRMNIDRAHAVRYRIAGVRLG